MKPCIIIHRIGRSWFAAYNEDGRLIVNGFSMKDCRKALPSDYKEVSLNSRIGRTILDKTDNKNNKFKPL